MLKTEIRKGAYYDSVVLMQLQRGLAALSGVWNAGVVMGTPANKDVLEQAGLLTAPAANANQDDLIIVINAERDINAQEALTAIDGLLRRKRTGSAGGAYRPKSMDVAAKSNPDSGWVLVSVPGRYAAGVAEEGLRLGKNVFLYSDNVSVEDEVKLKRQAANAGLLVMGPDCGTAIINGVGLGFANGVRSGSIGLVGASGTGLQQVTARIHQLGGGITHAIGTGGRDLTIEVGAVTARQALDLLSRDAKTSVIVLISKPPSASVAAELIQVAQATGKPTVVNFIGYEHPVDAAALVSDQITFARTLDDAAAQAVQLERVAQSPASEVPMPALPCYLRALYSGGTLAYECQLLLRPYLPVVYSNAPLDDRFRLEKAALSQGHTVVDLGEDEFTVGRLHPMMDNDLRVQRIEQEAADPETGIILLDLVLGYGAHANPAEELADAISMATRNNQGREQSLDVIAIVVGTELDPQGLDNQVELLRASGATVFFNHEEAINEIGQRLRKRNRPSVLPAVELNAISAPLSAINVGLESFTDSLLQQGAEVIQLDWRPPAGGNERLAGILSRMKSS